MFIISSYCDLLGCVAAYLVGHFAFIFKVEILYLKLPAGNACSTKCLSLTFHGRVTECADCSSLRARGRLGTGRILGVAWTENQRGRSS